MRNLFCLFVLLIGGAAVLPAQPVVFKGGVVNVASYAPVGLPNSSIAQGSLFVVFGSKMGPAQLQQVFQYPLQTTFGGTSIKVTVGGTTVDALMIYTSDGQVAAVMPSNTPVGNGTLFVTFNGQTSAGAAVTIIDRSFGIFTVNQAGSGPAVVTDPKFNAYSLTASANPDDIATLWGTGLGKVAGNEAGGPLPGNMPNVPVELFIGLQRVNTLYQGRSGCCAAVDQIQFAVPNILGCHVPVIVKIGDIVSNVGTMPIAAKGGRTCSDPNAPSPSDLERFQAKGTVSFGGIGLSRNSTTMTLPPPFGTGQPTTTTSDSGSAVFESFDFNKLNAAQNPFQASTFGTCIVSTFKGGGGQGSDPIKPVLLDAGAAININGPNGAKALPKDARTGLYFAQLGGGTPPNVTPLYLSGGSYGINNGVGGKDVGGLNFNMTVFSPLTWTNQDSINAVQRSAGVDVTWSGGDPAGTVQITGTSIKLGTAQDGSDTVGASFVCTERQPALHFTVPPVVLLLLPAGGGNPNIPIPTGSLGIGEISTTTFTAPGLDFGGASSSVFSLKSLNYN